MKIGDKVRFLSDTGGGFIAGIKGKIVLVEDEDGFQIPTPINEVVIVEDSATDRAKMRIDQHQRGMEDGEDNRSIKQRLSTSCVDDEGNEDWRNVDTDVTLDDDPSLNFDAPVKERVGGDELSLYLAFVPQDTKALSTSNFKSYLINDSNYYVHFSYLIKTEDKWNLKAVGELEPNMKLLIENFTLANLNEMLHGCIQLHAYKHDKTFDLKPTCDIQVNIDAVKFYKLNTFRDNLFFDEPALIYTLVENDKLKENQMIEALRVKEEVTSKASLTNLNTSNHSEDVKIEEKAKKLANPYKSKSPRLAKQMLNDDKIVIDLHADKLLETTTGMSSSDILEYQLDTFRRIIEQYKSQKGKKIIFIHGKGEGVLRHALIHELNYKYKHFSYQDASFREYGYGATQVTIK